jgi:endo-1,4-beta-xylanase
MLRPRLLPAPRHLRAVPPLVAAMLAVALAGLTPRHVAAQTVVQHDFEDGTTQGWIPRGSAVLSNTTAAANTGTHSLQTTGRSAGFHGPSLSLLGRLSPGTVYQVTVSVRLLPSEAPTQLIVTVQRTPAGGSSQFDRVVASAAGGVTDGSWVTLQGLYSFAGDVSGLLLYVESPSPTAAFYLDDFRVVVVPAVGCAEPQDTSGIHSNFETGTTEGWGPRIGRETVQVTAEAAHGGSFSLLTTGRQAAFDGAAINAAGKLCNGSRYVVNLWARLAPGQAPAQLRVSIQRSFGGVTNFNTVVPNTTVTADQWVRLRATYDFVFNYTSLTLYVESASAAPSFYIDDFDLTFVPPPVAERDIASVHETLAPYFPVGAAVWAGDLAGEHAFLLKKHFNSLTSENDMKWSSLQPTEGSFTFAAADAQVALARANSMRVRGHTLVWHNQTPAWVFNDASGAPLTPTPENKALLLQRLENHIRAVVAHFGDDVQAWDVVNEVIDPGQADGFRRSPWFNITGTEYIDRAFHVAREVAPNARLYINDYDTTNVTKRAFLLQLVADLKARGVPVDGIGHQMHNNVDFPSAEAILATINLFAGLGVDNDVTELDVSIYSNSFPGPVAVYEDIPADRFLRQAFRYRDFFQAFRHLADKIGSVTFWGQADDHTWLTTGGRVNAPLLFDPSLLHKLAYTAIVEPSALPGAGSTAVFSGAYRVAPPGGGVRPTAAASFSLSNNGPSGTLSLNFNDHDTRVRFHGAAVITYRLSTSTAGTVVDFTVVGELNNQPGYILTGQAVDGGAADSGLDTISLSVRTPTGGPVYSSSGVVSDGDVVITP